MTKPTPRRALPPPYRPQLALLVEQAPEGDGSIHEPKLDGYRIGCLIDRGKVELISRRDQRWTESFPAVYAAAAKLKVKNALLDGEVAVLDPSGKTSFQRLQSGFKNGEASDAVYFVFDLLFLDGEDLTELPLEERKSRLRELVGSTSGGALRFVDHHVGRGPTVFQSACELGFEGIVSKRRGGKYLAGKRDASWQKIKCTKRQEFVIGGFTDPEGSREGIGALLVGYYDAGKLVFAGKVGTGYTRALALELRATLGAIERMESPFAERPAGWTRWGVHWVAPRYVGEVAFAEWTNEGLLRHPAFKGLRRDKKPNGVVREVPKKGR